MTRAIRCRPHSRGPSRAPPRLKPPAWHLPLLARVRPRSWTVGVLCRADRGGGVFVSDRLGPRLIEDLGVSSEVRVWDLYAAAALGGLEDADRALAWKDPQRAAQWAGEWADALLAERRKREEPTT